jgi:citrate lyase subunit beta/citryl-CoA lyase
MLRPRRSLLFMPGSNARALEKARSLPADGIILDLEDAVAPDAKQTARDMIAAAVAAGGFGAREVLIRVNGLDTPWWRDDLAMAAASAPDGVVVPKISSVADLALVGDHLAATKAPAKVKVWAMLETALALLHVETLSATAREAGTRLAGYIMGPNDIARETRIRMVPGRAPMLSFYTTCVLAAHAYGLEILDGPFSDFSDAAGFAAECAQSRDMGFDGKTLIHPSQIEACNLAFTPPADEVAQARTIVAAFARPENAGRGAIQLNGRMVERLHAEIAQRTIAIADAIAAKG